jgi:hypothetical protein
MPVLQLPWTDSQLYYASITTALDSFTIVLRQYHNCPGLIHNCIMPVLQLP